MVLESHTQARRVTKIIWVIQGLRKCPIHRSILKEILENILQGEENKRKQSEVVYSIISKEIKKHLLLKRKGYGFKFMVRKQIRLKVKKKLCFQLKKHEKMLMQNVINGRT